MDPKTTLASAAVALLAAAALLPAPTSALPGDEALLPVAELTLEVVDGVPTVTLSHGESVACVAPGETTGSSSTDGADGDAGSEDTGVAVDYDCGLGALLPATVGVAPRCVQLGAAATRSGSAGASAYSACTGASASCSVPPGTACQSTWQGQTSDPWRCRLSAYVSSSGGSASAKCWVRYG